MMMHMPPSDFVTLRLAVAYRVCRERCKLIETAQYTKNELEELGLEMPSPEVMVDRFLKKEPPC